MSDILLSPPPEPAVPPSASASVGGSGSRVVEPDLVVPASTRPGGSEPLARIEDKTSRIEEKLARSEAAMQRVVDRFELASARMSEVASQSELAALRGEVQFIARRVRASVGPGALVVSTVATAILTAVVVVLLLRYVPALAPPR